MSLVPLVGRRSKRRARESLHAKTCHGIDLNSPPADIDALFVVTATPVADAGSSSFVPEGNRQVATSQFIDLEAVEDDVQVLFSSSWIPQPANRPARSQPVTVLLDDDEEMNSTAGINLEEPVSALLSLGINTHTENLFPVINCDLYPDHDETTPVLLPEKRKLVHPYQEPPAAAKEPTFSCPICMNTLVEPSSTSCGHIFCKSCISTAIRVQKKCPTCRRKLKMNNFHRVYLPTTE